MQPIPGRTDTAHLSSGLSLPTCARGTSLMESFPQPAGPRPLLDGLSEAERKTAFDKYKPSTFVERRRRLPPTPTGAGGHSKQSAGSAEQITKKGNTRANNNNVFRYAGANQVVPALRADFGEDEIRLEWYAKHAKQKFRIQGWLFRIAGPWPSQTGILL